jgi:hypothetical protein
MPTVAVQVTIGDYAKWRPVFDKHQSLRDKAGFKNTQVYRNADDPNEVIVWGEAANGAKVRRALADPELTAAMKEAGVVGPPRVHIIPFSPLNNHSNPNAQTDLPG